MTEPGAEEGNQMSTHTESNNKAGHGIDHPFRIVMRNLAGHSETVTVKPSDVVADVRDDVSNTSWPRVG